MKNIIEVKDVEKNIGDKKIINNMTFNVKEGEIFVLLGPNGVGKSTIIKLINNILEIDKGEILINGSPISISDKQDIGILSDSTLLYNHLTAMENLYFWGQLYGLSKQEVKVKGEQLLKEFDLYDVKDKVVENFSTGMKKRIQLIKAVIHSPKILFLDEPTSGLDPESAKEVNNHIIKLNKENKMTVVLCSHHLDEVEVIGDTFAFINKGELFNLMNRQDIESNYFYQIKIKTVSEKEASVEVPFISGIDFHNKLNSLMVDGTIIEGIELIKPSLREIYFKVIGDRTQNENKYK